MFQAVSGVALTFPCSSPVRSLMFINISPVDASVNESINSLRFATKVGRLGDGFAACLV